jgi:Mn2+/Fe2+ NRAMP family transporter
MGLLIPGPVLLFTVLLGLLSCGLEISVSYNRYAKWLKWSTLSLLSYAAVMFVAKVPPGEALRGLAVPAMTFDKAHTMALVAIFGTTISPYLFFWQAAQEVEEQHRRHLRPLRFSRRIAQGELKRIRLDTLFGMGFSHLTALFIMVATAATLHAHGITDIASPAQAAEALRPIAGNLAFALFAIGMIGTGLLAVPTLAGSAAYAVSECFGWAEGLDKKPRQAKAFYGVIALATLGGILINLAPIDPMRAL